MVLLGHGIRVSYRIVANPGLQGDLRIYHAAAKAYAEGRDPYDAGALTGAAGKTQQLPFVYPPASLPALRALLVFDYRATYFAFFALKMAGVIALVLLWQRWLFPDAATRACLYLLCALAYGQTIKMDVRAGNISVFEQLLIWTAALAFVHRRPWLFAALVSTAAVFKVTAAGLLLLLLLDRDRRNAAALLAATAGLAVVHGISAALRPELFAGFVRNAASLDDRGRVNPSALALIRDGLERVATGMVPSYVEAILYGLVVLMVGLAFLSVARRHDFRGDREGAVFAAFFAYALAMPRFKDYSYILLIPPSVYVVVKVLRGFGSRLLALCLLCTHLVAYQSWFTALFLFTAYLAHLLRTARRPPAPAAAPRPA